MTPKLPCHHPMTHHLSLLSPLHPRRLSLSLESALDISCFGASHSVLFVSGSLTTSPPLWPVSPPLILSNIQVCAVHSSSAELAYPLTIMEGESFHGDLSLWPLSAHPGVEVGGGDSCKLLVRAFVYWVCVGGIGSYPRRAGTAHLGQSLCPMRGMLEACGKDLPPRAISSAFSSGFSWAVPSWNAPGVLSVPGAHPSPAPSPRLPV